MIWSYSPLTTAKRLGVHACGLAVLAAIPALSYGVAIRPLHARTADAVRQRDQLVLLNQSADSIRQDVAALTQQVAATEQDLRRLLDQLPDRPSLEALLAVVSEAAEASHAEILSLQPVSDRSAAEAAVQRLRLRLRCDHASLCRFLAALDDRPLPVWVARVELQSDKLDLTGRGGGIRYADLLLHVPHAPDSTFSGQTSPSLSPPPEA